MEKNIVEQTTDMLRKLSPQNQTYFMTLVRVAAIAEENCGKEEEDGTRKKTKIAAKTKSSVRKNMSI